MNLIGIPFYAPIIARLLLLFGICLIAIIVIIIFGSKRCIRKSSYTIPIQSIKDAKQLIHKNFLHDEIKTHENNETNKDVYEILTYELNRNCIPKVLHKIIHLFLIFPNRFNFDDDWSCLNYIFGSSNISDINNVNNKSDDGNNGAISFSCPRKIGYGFASDILINGKRTILEFELVFDRHLLPNFDSKVCLNTIHKSRNSMNNIKTLIEFYRKIESLGKKSTGIVLESDDQGKIIMSERDELTLPSTFPIHLLKSENEIKHMERYDYDYINMESIRFDESTVPCFLYLHGPCNSFCKKKIILRISEINISPYASVRLALAN